MKMKSKWEGIDLLCRVFREGHTDNRTHEQRPSDGAKGVSVGRASPEEGSAWAEGPEMAEA